MTVEKLFKDKITIKGVIRKITPDVKSIYRYRCDGNIITVKGNTLHHTIEYEIHKTHIKATTFFKTEQMSCVVYDKRGNFYERRN